MELYLFEISSLVKPKTQHSISIYLWGYYALLMK